MFLVFSMADFEYHKNWKRKCRITLSIMPRCCCNPLHPGEVVHHVKYKRCLSRRLFGIFLLHNPLKVSVSGYEIPGWDVVPVCNYCHSNEYGRSSNLDSVHHPKHWIQHKNNRLSNRNTLIKMWRLRFNFWLCVGLMAPLRIVFFFLLRRA